ncbi:MAG: hypothetical protein N2651_01655 [Fimbriimonadales bacterium]|nr:hypothetical protein [Fimbriimonadales bacterium]
MDTRALLKACYYAVLWEREPAFKDAYRQLLGLPLEAQVRGLGALQQQWQLPPDALQDMVQALRRGDTGSEDTCPFGAIGGGVVERKQDDLPPPPNVPAGSSLPFYDPDAYATFGEYLQALQDAYRGLACPTPQEREYVSVWQAFTAQVQGNPACEAIPVPPFGLPDYLPDSQTRESYINWAVGQVDLQQATRDLPYGAYLTDALRREIVRAILIAYCTKIEERAGKQGIKLRREQGRELDAESARQWAEYLYLRLQAGWTWGQISAWASRQSGRKVGRSAVQTAVRSCARTLGVKSVR